MSYLSNNLLESLNYMDYASFRAAAALEWIEFNKKGCRLSDFFRENKMEKVAVYGYGKLGKMFVEDVQSEGIQMAYIIDRNAGKIQCPFPIYSLDDELPFCDIVVVTISGYNLLREKLWLKGIKNVISLKELLMRR